MTRAAILIAALALSGCLPTPADVCAPGLRGLLINATGSDAANVAIACNIVK